MFNSRLFTAIMVLTTLALIALAAFQCLEMKEYDLFNTLKERFF